MKKYSQESKLALIISVLGFMTIILLDHIGLLIGVILLIIGLYLSLKIKKEAKANELSKLAFVFSTSGLAFAIIIVFMLAYIKF